MKQGLCFLRDLISRPCHPLGVLPFFSHSQVFLSHWLTLQVPVVTARCLFPFCEASQKFGYVNRVFSSVTKLTFLFLS